MISVPIYSGEMEAHSLEVVKLGFEPCLSISHTLLLAQDVLLP